MGLQKRGRPKGQPYTRLESIEILATSGELEVRGGKNDGVVVVTGRACTDEKENLDSVQIIMQRIDNRLQIIADVPYREDDEWRVGSLDLEIDLPSNLPITVSDSSGNLTIRGVASLELSDSSGDIDIDGAESVTIDQDTSGNINIRNVRTNVSIGTDSSGAIRVNGVGGDFTVAQDTSGGIKIRDVAGAIHVPE